MQDVTTLKYRRAGNPNPDDLVIVCWQCKCFMGSHWFNSIRCQQCVTPDYKGERFHNFLEEGN